MRTTIARLTMLLLLIGLLGWSLFARYKYGIDYTTTFFVINIIKTDPVIIAPLIFGSTILTWLAYCDKNITWYDLVLIIAYWFCLGHMIWGVKYD